MQAGSKIVGAAVGQVAQQRAALQLHQTGDGLIQGAVAAGADYHIVLRTPFGRVGPGFAAGLRQKDPHQIASAGKGGHRIEQGGVGFRFARLWIDNEQELLHGSPPICR